MSANENENEGGGAAASKGTNVDTLDKQIAKYSKWILVDGFLI